jgi:hypothetical protein
MARWQDYVLRGDRASQPAANSVAVGTLYYVTDESVTERSDGASWESYSDAGGGGEELWEPGGRLTLSTGVPVMISDVSNSTSIFYTPYVHDRVPIYDGASWVMTEFTELTNTTTDSTKNPAAVGNNSNYDLFVWDDSGTLRLGRGPAWTSDTARGTGAGTTELERVNGVWMNKITIANGPAAQRGTYVGTVRSDGSATIDWELGGTAGGGDPAFLYVWNAYNRRQVCIQVMDDTDSWAYTTATWRSANNSTSNRISWILGLAEDGIQLLRSSVADGVGCRSGIGYDRTNGTDSSRTYIPVSGALMVSLLSRAPALGLHFAQAVEIGAAGGVFYGDAGGTDGTTGINAVWTG